MVPLLWLLAAHISSTTQSWIAPAHLQTVLLSLDLSASALQALGHTTAALDAHEYRIEPYVAKRGAPEPVAPELPKVLPHVHQLWAPLLAALKARPLKQLWQLSLSLR